MSTSSVFFLFPFFKYFYVTQARDICFGWVVMTRSNVLGKRRPSSGTSGGGNGQTRVVGIVTPSGERGPRRGQGLAGFQATRSDDGRVANGCSSLTTFTVKVEVHIGKLGKQGYTVR